MTDSYMTRRYTVTPLGAGYEVSDLAGKHLRWLETLEAAREVADLYQADDDDERARAEWDERNS